MSQWQLESVRDVHVETLVKNCNKLIELCLCCTSITNNSLASINKYLKNTLEKLDLYGTEIEFEEILESLKSSFSVLKVFNWCPIGRPGSGQVEILKMHFPYLRINENQMCIRIASPCQSFEAESGFWEIENKQIKLFRKNYWR